jgi:hypothetical protein
VLLDDRKVVQLQIEILRLIPALSASTAMHLAVAHIFLFPHRVFPSPYSQFAPEKLMIVYAHLTNLNASDREIAQKLGLLLHVVSVTFFMAFETDMKPSSG